MNQILISLVCGWAQAFVVAGLAIVLSRLALRRSPTASAGIAGAGIIATLVLTVLVPAPVPHWELRSMARRSASIVPIEQSPRPADISPASSEQHELARERIASGATFDWEILASIIAAIQPSRALTIRTAAGQTVLGLLVMIVLGMLLSMIRLAYGAWAIAMLHRGSRDVEDRHVADMLNSLGATIGIRRIPPVRESDSLLNAAVVGWCRPTVMFPSHWREWSTPELRAVLAHELAHIHRRDPVMRLVAAFTVGLQCVQPLVYWLRRQLMLAQELAADELASEAVGNRVEYLHALSKLALRQDTRPMDGPAAMLLPVFSGFLLRRIEMLRAKDGSKRLLLQRTMQWSAITILVAAATSVTALRGLAQQPEAKSDGSARVARLPDGKSKPGATDSHAAAATLFQRPAFDLASVGVRDSNGFVIRLGEILRHPEISGETRALDDWFAASWKDAFPGSEAPFWSLKDIEFIAGDLRFSIKPLPQPTKENATNQVMFGSQWIVVRSQQPVNALFESLQRLTVRPGETGTAPKSHGNVAYVELPIIPALGPKNVCVCRLDDRTIMIADETTVIARLDDTAPKTSPPTWHKSWKSVEGGLLSFISTDKEIVREVKEPRDDQAKLYQHLHNARLYSLGVDWQPQAKGIGVVKVQLRFDDEAKAVQFRSALRGFVEKLAQEFDGELTKMSDAKAQAFAEIQLALLRTAKVETRQVDGVWQVDLQLAGPFDLQEVLKRL